MGQVSTKKLVRREDWPTRLAEYVGARLAQPFEWGENDCATFAAGAVEAMTDTNPMAGVYSYRTGGGAKRLLAKKQLATRVSERLLAMGCQAIEPVYAQRGDVVMFEQGDGIHAVGVCIGGAALAPGENGVARVPIRECLAAWRVG